MLCAGVIIGNMPYMSAIDPVISGALRKGAFVVILVQGGLGLDLVALKKLKCLVVIN